MIRIISIDDTAPYAPPVRATFAEHFDYGNDPTPPATGTCDSRRPGIAVRMLRAAWRLVTQTATKTAELIRDERTAEFVRDCSTMLCALVIWLIAGVLIWIF